MNHLTVPPIAVVFAFTSLNESLIEYLFGSVSALRPYLPLLGLAMAIFLAFAYQIDIFTGVLGVDSGNPFLNFLFSGFLMSRGSNFINDFAQKVLGSK